MSAGPPAVRRRFRVRRLARVVDGVSARGYDMTDAYAVAAMVCGTVAGALVHVAAGWGAAALSFAAMAVMTDDGADDG